MAAAAATPLAGPRTQSGLQPGAKAFSALDAAPPTTPPAAAGRAGSATNAAVSASLPPAPVGATGASSQAALTPLAADNAPSPVANSPAAAQPPSGFATLLAQTQQTQPPLNTEAAVAARPSEMAAMQFVQAPAAAPIATGPSDAVPAAVYQAALPSRPLDAPFGGDLAAEVRVMINGGMQRAELSLNPPELGPVRIELTLSAQTADINFVAAHSMTREGLSLALPELRQMLAGQGLSLGHAGVSSGQQGQAFAEAQQQARPVPHGMRTAAGGPEAGGSWASGSAVVRPSRGMLDLYA